MVLQRLERLHVTLVRMLRPIDRRRADARGVLQAQFQRIHADLRRQHVDHALHRVGGDRRARRAIRRRLGPVAHHVVADGARIRDVVRRERAQAAVHHRRAGEGAGLELEQPVGRDQLAVLGDAHLHPHRRTRCRAGGTEHVVAVHHQPHRAARLHRQQRRDRLQIGHRLAAEAAADLGGIDAEVADRLLQDLRGQRAHLEVALARGPDLGLAIGVPARQAGVRLDIALVHRGGLELLLDHHIGRGKAGVDVAGLELQPLRDVGGLGRRRFDAAGDHVLEQQRRPIRHRLVHVDDVGQHLVVHLDQRRRLIGDRGADRGDRGHRMALVIGLLARHDVARDVPEIHRDALGTDVVEFLVRQVLPRHHRLDAGQLLGGRCVDRADARVRVRRAQDAAVQHAGQLVVAAVHGASRHLGHAVRTDRPGSYPLEALYRVRSRLCRSQLPRLIVLDCVRGC